MQDYSSNGFATSLTNKFAANSSTNFAPNPYALPVHMLAQRPVQPQPSNRREFISQQEKKIRTDYLRKPAAKSTSVLPTKGSAKAHLQGYEVSTNRKPAFRLKFAAAAIVVGLVLFTGQFGYTVLSQQLAMQGLHQSSPGHSDAAASFKNSVACVESTAIVSNGTTAPAGFANAVDAQKGEASDAAAKSALASVTADSNQATQNLSELTSDVNQLNLTSVTTPNLVKIGYERLRAGSAKESISLLSEAVRRDRNDPTSRRYLGYALAQAGRPSEALQQYAALQKLSGLLPADRLAMQHAASLIQSKDAFSKLGGDDNVISKYRAAIVSNPKDFSSKYDLAVICSKSGRTEEAIHECLTGMNESPSCSVEQQKFYLLYASLAPMNPARS